MGAKRHQMDHFRPQKCIFSPQNFPDSPQISHFGPTQIYGVEKTPKIPYSQPQKPHKKPYNRNGGEGVGKAPKSTIFGPKSGHFDPKIATIDPKKPHFGPTQIYGEEKTPKIPYSQPQKPQKPHKNPINATAVNGCKKTPKSLFLSPK